jgi:hypothetical protein
LFQEEVNSLQERLARSNSLFKGFHLFSALLFSTVQLVALFLGNAYNGRQDERKEEGKKRSIPTCFLNAEVKVSKVKFL